MDELIFERSSACKLQVTASVGLIDPLSFDRNHSKEQCVTL